MATKAKSNAAQKAILAEITIREARCIKLAQYKNQNALIRASRELNEAILRDLWIEYRKAA